MRGLLPWLALAALAYLLDCATTHAGLSAGAVEGNPLGWWLWCSAGAVGLLGAKLLIVGGVTGLMLVRCKRRRRLAWLVWRAGVVVTIVAVLSNAVAVAT